MAIDLNQMYVQKAVRLSLYDIDPAVTNVYAGQLFQLNAAGKWIVSVGTGRAYPTVNNRFPGAGLGPQGELLEGRDDVSKAGKIAVLKSNFEIGTDQYDTTKTYVNGAALYPSVTVPGKLTPFDSTNVAHKPEFICGYVTKKPATTADFLYYEN
jgi:hypothetical protein